MRFATREANPAEWGMKKLCMVVLFAGLAALQAADEAPGRPGFLRRAWEGTKKVGEKTVDAVKSPFARRKTEAAPNAGAWRQLEMTMKLDPPEVRLPATRVLEVKVTVVNKGKQAVGLEFPSSLRLDFVVKNEAGKLLSRWSDDQPINHEPAVILINPKERLEYTAKISTRDMAVGSRFEIEAYFPSYEGLRTARFVTPEG
jgi:hypothetical protein